MAPDRIDFFIAGSERSGTTVTCAMLDQYQDVCAMQGTTILTRLANFQELMHHVVASGGDVDGLKPENCESLADFVTRAKVTPFLHKSIFHACYYENMVNSARTDVTKDLFAHKKYLENFQFDRYMARYDPENPTWANTITALYAEFVHSVDAKGHIFGEQTPDNAMRIDAILKMYPAAKIIFLVRHPITGIASLLERYGDIPRAINQYRKPFTLYPFGDPDVVNRTLFVKFEDLVSNRAGVLASMAEFLGLDPEAAATPDTSHESAVFQKYIGKSLTAERYFRSVLKHSPEERAALYHKNLDIADIFYSTEETMGIIGHGEDHKAAKDAAEAAEAAAA
ncbi:MAG: sulfotransferase [Minwuia sp.]|nr:sulfotransferase [Minwuia sp.]